MHTNIVRALRDVESSYKGLTSANQAIIDLSDEMANNAAAHESLINASTAISQILNEFNKLNSLLREANDKTTE